MHFVMHLCTHSVMYVNALVILIYISLPSVYLSMYPSIHPYIHWYLGTYVPTYVRAYIHISFHSIPLHLSRIFLRFGQNHPSGPPKNDWGHWGHLGLLNLIETDGRWNNIIASWWLCLALWMSSCLGDSTSGRCGENRAIVGVN